MPTFGGRVSPGERTRRLSPHECKAWLCSHHEGRLGYQSGKGPRSVVVSYSVAEDQIWSGFLTTTTSCTTHRAVRSASTSMAALLPLIARLWWSPVEPPWPGTVRSLSSTRRHSRRSGPLTYQRRSSACRLPPSKASSSGILDLNRTQLESLPLKWSRTTRISHKIKSYVTTLLG